MKENLHRSKSILGACTMVYGEVINYWLIQWIEYNKNVVGVDRFYIYDDAGARPTRTETLLHDYIANGTVVYVPWPQIPKSGKVFERQIQGMNSCVHRFGKYHKYILVGDADEYIVPKIDYRKILAAESIMYPVEAGRAVAGIGRHKVMSTLMQGKGTLTVKNVDIGGMESAALENQDILWSIGDRICENGPTMDREKSFFYTNYRSSHFMSLIIDQGHNTVIYQPESRHSASYLPDNEFVMFHFWSGSADQSCRYVDIFNVERNIFLSSLGTNVMEAEYDHEETKGKILEHNAAVETFTWLHTSMGLHAFFRDRLRALWETEKDVALTRGN